MTETLKEFLAVCLKDQISFHRHVRQCLSQSDSLWQNLLDKLFRERMALDQQVKVRSPPDLFGLRAVPVLLGHDDGDSSVLLRKHLPDGGEGLPVGRHPERRHADVRSQNPKDPVPLCSE